MFITSCAPACMNMHTHTHILVYIYIGIHTYMHVRTEMCTKSIIGSFSLPCYETSFIFKNYIYLAIFW